LASIISRLPADAPGVVVVQHMPAGFTAQFASRMDRLSAMTVREATGGETIKPGMVYIAPGDNHLLVRKIGFEYQTELRTGPRVSRHKPSVDVLFKTVSEAAGSNALGVILTGMGRDGAKGLKLMKDAGAYTIAQDEASCVVYGMPREAVDIGAVDTVLPIDYIAQEICSAVTKCNC